MTDERCHRPEEDHRKNPLLLSGKVGAPVEKSEAVVVIEAYSEAVRELVRQKDKAYGGAWQKQGYMGNLARIMSKTARLEAILWSDNTGDMSGGEEVHPQYETITDTLKDLMALAAFCAANIEDGNRWGR